MNKVRINSLRNTQPAFSNEFDWQNSKAIIILLKRVSLFSCRQSSGRIHSHEEICV